MKVAQGDIVSVDFPFSDGTKTKRRPALVLSSDAIHKTGDLLLMQITSRSRKDGLNINLETKDLSNALPLVSFLRLHKVFTLDKNLVIRKLSHLEKNKFSQVISSLFDLLNEE